MQLARKLVGILLVEQDFQGVVLAVQVVVGDQLAEQRLLLADFAPGVAAFSLHLAQRGADAFLLLRQFPQPPVGRADGLLGLFKRIGGVGLFAFCAFDLFLQGLDAVAQAGEIVFRRGVSDECTSQPDGKEN